jgi:hypothetical protein
MLPIPPLMLPIPSMSRPNLLRPPMSSGMLFLVLVVAAACPPPTKQPDDTSITDTDITDTADTADTAAPPIQADILLVLDSSASMANELGGAGTQTTALITALEADTAVDYRIAITKPGANDLDGDGLDAGEGGLLVGAVVDASNADAALALRDQILCHTAYWSSDLPNSSEGSVDCSGPPTSGVVTKEYLDCVCGPGEWVNTPQGTGQEEHLESALMALCRSVGSPPAICSDPISSFATTSSLHNPEWIRADSTVHIVIVSDEGDSSRRIPGTGTESELATAYLQAFAQFDNPVVVSTIGPLFDPSVDSGPRCSEVGISAYLVNRLIDDSGGTCEATEFTEHYAALASLVRGE